MTLLLLAGSGEAQQVAQALAKDGTPVIASLAGATRTPRPMPVPVRVGGFGGAERFLKYVNNQHVTAVLDATHPFASSISLRTARLCKQQNIPYCQLLRPQWEPQPGDLWTLINDETEAAIHIQPGETVFLATGRQTLDRFANLSQCRLICRQIDPPDREFPFPNGEFLVGRPPFSVVEESNLFKALGVNWLVVKNAGSTASATKLTAARHLGIKVAMINRPPMPEALQVRSVPEALDWVAAL